MDLNKLVKEELSGNVAKQFVAEISRFHRVQASTMFHEAAMYVKNELLKMGLEDPVIEQYVSDGSKKYWTYTSPMGWTVRSAELRLIEPEDKLIVTYEDMPQSLHTYSKATPLEGVEGELVDVGAGNKHGDYDGKDVAGKFVLATGRAKSVHELAVFEYGALGVITDTITFELPNVRESLDIPDAHAYQSIWPTAEELPKVTFGFSLSKRQGNHLRALLKSGKKVKLKATVDAQLFAGHLDVVTAVIKGSTRPDEEVFLIAHLCHPKPSANDNASGSGLLLEIARTVTALIRKGKLERPRRTLRFIWVPETFGSIVYLHQHEDIPSRLVAGVNLDMVGQDQEVCRSTLNLDRTPDSLPSYLNDFIFSLMQESIKEFDVPSAFGSSSTFRYASGPFSGGSDHAEFTDSTIRVPCIMLLQWPDLYYHTSADTIDKVSPDSLRRVGWISTVAALRLANAATNEAFLLANNAASRGQVRIKEIGREAVEEMHRISLKLGEAESEKVAAELVSKTGIYQNKVEHAVWVEQEAVKSTLRLDDSANLQTFVNGCCEEIANIGRAQVEKTRSALRFFAESARIALSSGIQKMDAKDESSRLVPSRMFKGTLSFDILKSSLNEKEFEWYKKVDEEDKEFRKKAAELLNFMDGRRSLSEILKHVSAEYSEIKLEHALRFLKDLEKLKLVVLRQV